MSGARGGETIDFRRLAAQGLTLLGMTSTYQDGVMSFAPDLAKNIARGDASLMSLLDEADAYVARDRLDLSEEPAARRIHPDPECVTNPIRELDLSEAGIAAIVWATGFAVDYSWLKVDAFDEKGRPRHHRGVSSEPGSISWVTLAVAKRIQLHWGVWHDAKHVADRISMKRKYLAYHAAAKGQPRGCLT